MKVLVTGGTGFVGSHAVEALQAAGHEIRLLVRRPERVEAVLRARGVRVAEAVVGDVTDAGAVREALTGCDALLHAAATVLGGEAAVAANVAGVRNTLRLGCELGLDPLLYVSSIAVLFPPPGPVLRADDPVTHLATPYGRSKAEGERLARALQADGAPVVIFYPGGVSGPDEPGLSQMAKGLRDRLRFGWPITSGGITQVDVRDLARLFAAAMRPGQGPRRFMAGGHFLRWAEEADLCEALTGRRVRRVPAPGWLVRLVGRLLDLARRLVPIDYPLGHEAAQFVTRARPCDSQPTLDALGLHFRPVEETLAASIRWLHEAGHLEARLAGRLAAPAAPSPAASRPAPPA